jgi:hypothetical protein
VISPLSQRRQPQLRETSAQADQPGDKVDQLGIGVLPVEPGHRIVLAVGVVVAGLCAAEFVATLQHRHALGDEERGEQRALQAPAFFEHRRIVLSPSSPQFDEWLWPCPSRLSSPLSSLCFF